MIDKNSNESIIVSLQRWFESRLGCLPGKREYIQGRYSINIIDRTLSAGDAYRNFLSKIENHSASGCLFVFADIPSDYSITAECVFRILSDRVSQFTHENKMILNDNGKQISNSLTLRCPVTNQQVTFQDFDFIAFCPQATNEDDPLYNPSLEAPYPCINFTSDLFGFSLLVRDISVQLYGCRPYEIREEETLDKLFQRSAQLWQRLALNTMREYASRANKKKICPLHVNQAQTHWLSTHSDSAFASMNPHFHLQELPNSYTPRIIEQWKLSLKTGSRIDLASINVADMPYLPADNKMVRIRD